MSRGANIQDLLGRLLPIGAVPTGQLVNGGRLLVVTGASVLVQIRLAEHTHDP